MNILRIILLSVLFTFIVSSFSDTRPVDDVMVCLLAALVLALIKPDDKQHPHAEYRTAEVRPLRESGVKTGGVKDVPKTPRPERPSCIVVRGDGKVISGLTEKEDING